MLSVTVTLSIDTPVTLGGKITRAPKRHEPFEGTLVGSSS